MFCFKFGFAPATFFVAALMSYYSISKWHCARGWLRSHGTTFRPRVHSGRVAERSSAWHSVRMKEKWERRKAFENWNAFSLCMLHVLCTIMSHILYADGWMFYLSFVVHDLLHGERGVYMVASSCTTIRKTCYEPWKCCVVIFFFKFMENRNTERMFGEQKFQ